VGRLFWKIFLGFWLALVIAAVLTGTAVWLRHRSDTPPPESAGPPFRVAADLAAATLRHGGVEALRAWMMEAQFRRPVAVFAVDALGHDILEREVPPAALAAARSRADQSGDAGAARTVTAAGGGTYLVFATRTPGPRPLPPRRAPPLSPWQLIAIGIATSLVFSMLLAWYLTRPIRSLRWAFDAAAAGKLETRVSPRMGRRRDEIADLGRDFDRMALQLQKLVSAQQRLLHDVSHELRSPLARLQAAIGLARQNPAKLDASLGRIEREANRLEHMVGEMLALARLESGTTHRPKERVDLAYLAANIAEDARFEAEAVGRGLKFSAEGDAPVMGDPDLLHRAIENVVRNAVKFTREGTAVEVNVHTTNDAAVLTVSDQGPGITSAELATVFDPFYRGEAGNGAPGFGLGLAIAQRAIDAHGGAIRAANAPRGGLQVEIELPLAHGNA